MTNYIRHIDLINCLNNTMTTEEINFVHNNIDDFSMEVTSKIISILHHLEENEASRYGHFSYSKVKHAGIIYALKAEQEILATATLAA